jgi:hydrophobe/amphiphile efflux-3 (HAE3) family protein
MISDEQFLAAAVLVLGSGTALASFRPAWIVGYPRTVLAMLGALTLGVALLLVSFDPLALRIDVDASSKPMLPHRDAAQDIYRQATLDFGPDDIYVIAMETEDVFTVEEMTVLRDVSNGINALEGVSGIESLVDVYEYRYDFENDWLDFGRFMDRVPEEQEAYVALRSRALANLIYTKVVVSKDGRTAALNITFQAMDDGEFIRRDMDGQIRAILAEHATPERKFFVTGRPHIRTEAYHLLIRDMLVLLPIAVAVAAFLLWVMTGSIRGTFVPLASNLMSTFWVYGAMVLVGRDLNVITLVLGPMLICVGAVYGVHSLARYGEIAGSSPDSRTAALRTLEYTRAPVLMSGLTTMVGFGALLLANVPAVTELGAFAVFGVANVTLLSLTFVPAALALLPLRRGDVELFGPRTNLSLVFRRVLDARLTNIGALCTRFPSQVLVFWVIASIGAVLIIPRIVIDTDYLSFFLEDSLVRTDFAAINRLLTGAVPIYVVANGTEEGTFREPAGMRAIARIQTELEAVEGVGQVLTAVDLVRLANEASHENDPNFATIPETRPALAELIFMLPKEKLGNFLNSNHSKSNLIVRTSRLGSAEIRALQDRMLAAIERANVPDHIETHVTGNSILINRSADGIAGNQTLQVGLAVTAIFILVTVVFRSAKLGLIAMAPNIVPVLLFFGALGAGAAPLSIPTSLIACIALGMAVDNTVHFLTTYQRERQAKGLSAAEAVNYCVRTIGRPIGTTSIMLVIGFLVITFSGFATLREFGYLTGTTMAICMSTDLGLLPALVTRLKP